MAIDRYSYPFTAIVGQEQMKLALVLNAINPAIGGVLIGGGKGTGKPPAVRALAKLLPEQQVVEGCHFGCHPDDPEDFCLHCRERSRAGALPVPTRRLRGGGALRRGGPGGGGRATLRARRPRRSQPQHPLRRRGQPS